MRSGVKQDDNAAAAFFGVLIISLFLICFYEAAKWFLSHYGKDGLACIFAGLEVATITGTGVFWLIWRWTSRRTKKLSLRRAALERECHVTAFISVPLISEVLIISLLFGVAYPGDLIAGLIVVFGVVGFFLLGLPGMRLVQLRHPLFNQKLFCPGCRRYIETDCVWTCGDCFHKNENAQEHSFLQYCERCGNYPNAYECPHAGCGYSVYLGYPRKNEQRMSAHLATKWTEPEPTKVETAEELVARRRVEAEELQHTIWLTRLSGELVAAERERDKHAPQNSRQMKERNLARFKAHHADVHEIAAQELAWGRTEFQGNPSARRRHKMVIDAWVEDELAKGVGDDEEQHGK